METSKFEDHLWQEIVREHGDDLAQLRRPVTRHGLRRPGVVAGAGVGLAGGATALALVLSAASAPPAFAVTLNHNGTVTVTVRSASAIAAVNAKLHQLGIRAKVLTAAPASCRAVAAESAPPNTPLTTGAGSTLGTGTTTGGTASTNATGTQWTFGPPAPAHSVVLTPPAAGSNGTTANQALIWTCTAGAVAVGRGTSPGPGATGKTNATGNSAVHDIT
jgi:hypothetical protein